jgi:hypothetical protein
MNQTVLFLLIAFVCFLIAFVLCAGAGAALAGIPALGWVAAGLAAWTLSRFAVVR